MLIKHFQLLFYILNVNVHYIAKILGHLSLHTLELKSVLVVGLKRYGIGACLHTTLVEFLFTGLLHVV